MGATHGAAVTFANAMATGGFQDAATGDFFLGDTVTINEPGGEWANADVPLIKWNALSAA